MNTWFRMYGEMINDPKIGTLNDAEFRTWVELMCLASNENKNGETGITAETADWVLRRNVTVTLQKLLDRDLVTKNAAGVLVIKNWDKRQYKSDSSAERVRRHREKQRSQAASQPDNGQRNVTVTLQQQQANAPTDTDTDTDVPSNNLHHPVVTTVGAAPDEPATPPAPAVVVEQFALAPTEPAPGEEVFLRFPLNDGTAYNVTMAAVSEWQGYYPGVDVPQQLRNLLGWCQTNPTKRKTRRGFPAFVTNALSRKQDQAGRVPAYRESATDRRSRIDAALFSNEPAGYPAPEYRDGCTIEQ